MDACGGRKDLHEKKTERVGCFAEASVARRHYCSRRWTLRFEHNPRRTHDVGRVTIADGDDVGMEPLGHSPGNRRESPGCQIGRTVAAGAPYIHEGDPYKRNDATYDAPYGDVGETCRTLPARSDCDVTESVDGNGDALVDFEIAMPNLKARCRQCNHLTSTLRLR